MNIFKNGELVYSYVPTYGGQKIRVAIDSSKTNTAIAVGDCNGNILDDYELSGAGADVDVYQFCWDMRRELKSLFTGADVISVGIEDIITKNEKKGYKGISVHQSRAKITAVFDNLIFFFQDNHNITPRRINNQSWKSAVLPEEFRTREHKKGSKDWFQYIGNKWADRKDDVTDVVCIFMYMCMTEKVKPVYDIKETFPSKFTYSVGLLPKSYPIDNSFKEFVIKNNDSLEHNADTISNNLEKGQYGYAVIPVSSVPIEWIYSDKLKYTATYKYGRNESELILIVCRE